MGRLMIDGAPVELREGMTVLEACRAVGVEIPTMCHLSGRTHFTSCMVCMVKQRGEDGLIPACSALAQDGMQIETGTPEVVEARRVALELLLSEHVGECEGMCERVCPAQIEIPGVLRALADGDRARAAAVCTRVSAAGAGAAALPSCSRSGTTRSRRRSRRLGGI